MNIIPFETKQALMAVVVLDSLPKKQKATGKREKYKLWLTEDVKTGENNKDFMLKET